MIDFPCLSSFSLRLQMPSGRLENDTRGKKIKPVSRVLLWLDGINDNPGVVVCDSEKRERGVGAAGIHPHRGESMRDSSCPDLLHYSPAPIISALFWFEGHSTFFLIKWISGQLTKNTWHFYFKSTNTEGCWVCVWWHKQVDALVLWQHAELVQKAQFSRYCSV